MYVLGIDPGLKGALCVLSKEGIIEVIKMPTTTRPHRKGNYIDVEKVDNFISKYRPLFASEYTDNYIQHISIERQFILRSQGMSSGSKTMYQSGILYGLCYSHCYSLEEVNAKDWQKAIFSKVDESKIKTYSSYTHTKLKSIAYVEQTYGLNYLFTSSRQSVPSDGLADAICIASFALEQNNKYKI